VSQANAKQRAGRSGRVQAGKCYRLYPKAVFDAMEPYLKPEMQRMSLENVALVAKSIGEPPGSLAQSARLAQPAESALMERCMQAWHALRRF
jgi:HrpA-like RNA helicase